VAVTREHLVWAYVDGDVQISRRSAAQSRFTLTGQPDPLPVLHARGYPDVDGAGSRRDTGALAFIAGVLDDRPAAAALGRRLGEAESPLIAVDYARAVTRRADLRAGARPGSAAMAVGARRRAGQPQRHRYALGGLHEAEFGLGLQVVAATRPAGPGLCSASEQSAEQVPDVVAAAAAGRVEQIVEVELSAVPAHTAAP